MASTIMLSKDFDEKKISYPVFVSEKYDGVPAKIFWNGADVVAQTRQGNFLTSIPHIVDDPTVRGWIVNGYAVVGECVISGADFKYTSGKVRAAAPCTDIIMRVYDVFSCDESGMPTPDNDTVFFNDRVPRIHAFCGPSVFAAVQHKAYCQSDVEFIMDCDSARADEVEGYIVRMAYGRDSTYKVARSWGLQRIVPKPTKDLLCVNIWQAVDKNGNSKDEVGALTVEWKGQRIKVGAGKATREERRAWWDDPSLIVGHIVKVQHKKDDSYSALRQPTFQCIRDDKEELDG